MENNRRMQDSQSQTIRFRAKPATILTAKQTTKYIVTTVIPKEFYNVAKQKCEKKTAE